jgi:hypothetical protein
VRNKFFLGDRDREMGPLIHWTTFLVLISEMMRWKATEMRRWKTLWLTTTGLDIQQA